VEVQNGRHWHGQMWTTWFPRKEGGTPSGIQRRVSARLWTEGTRMQHRVRLGAELRQWQGDRIGRERRRIHPEDNKLLQLR